MTLQRYWPALIILPLIIFLLFPRVVGNLAGEAHSAYRQTMQERGAEAYRRKNP